MNLRDLSKGAFAEHMMRVRAAQRGEVPAPVPPPPVPVEERIDPKTRHTALQPKSVREPELSSAWACVLANVLVIRSALGSAIKHGAGVFQVPHAKAMQIHRAGLLLFAVSHDMVSMVQPYLDQDLYFVDKTTPGRAALFYFMSDVPFDLAAEKPLFEYHMQAHHDLLARGNWPAPNHVVQLSSRTLAATRTLGPTTYAARVAHSEGSQVHYELHPYVECVALPTFVFNMIQPK